MSDELHTPEEILHSSQVLRAWSAGLRGRAREAGERAAAERRRAHSLSILRRADRRAPEELVLPPLGSVKVSELFTILVERHGFGVMDAVRALAFGMLAAGYPSDHDVVSAADAFDIVDAALAGRR